MYLLGAEDDWLPAAYKMETHNSGKPDQIPHRHRTKSIGPGTLKPGASPESQIGPSKKAHRAWASPPGVMRGTCHPRLEILRGHPPEITVFKENFLNICQKFQIFSTFPK